MTVGSQVKVCFASIKNAEAMIQVLANKTQNEQDAKIFQQAGQMLAEVKSDLEKQITFLTIEEPQY